MSTDDLVIGCDGIGDPEPPEAAQVATAVAFLRLLTPTHAATWQSPGSYGLKHDAEQWGRVNGLEPYVSNGALIAAAVELGYPIWYRRGSNAAIGVSKRDLRHIRETAPAGGTWTAGR